MGRWGHDGRWPATLRNVICALVPKAKAQNESQLKPIGRLPYVPRIWMAMRTGQHIMWSMGLHDARPCGGHARKPHKGIHGGAMVQWKTHIKAFLGCNTYYESINHWTPRGARTTSSAMQTRVANLVFDMYKGDKNVRAHGAVARPKKGNHGFVAGCVFAQDILKACLTEAKNAISNW